MFIAKEDDTIVASSIFKENLEKIGFSNIEEVEEDNSELVNFLGSVD